MLGYVKPLKPSEFDFNFALSEGRFYVEEFLLLRIMLYNLWEFPTIPHFYVAYAGDEKCIHLFCCEILNLEWVLAKCTFVKHIEKCRLKGSSSTAACSRKGQFLSKSESRLCMALLSQVLRLFKAGDYTASLRNSFQCLIALRVNFFFHMSSEYFPLYFLLQGFRDLSKCCSYAAEPVTNSTPATADALCRPEKKILQTNLQAHQEMSLSWKVSLVLKSSMHLMTWLNLAGSCLL